MATKRTPHLRLKKLRKIIGFTQVKLAEKCGVSYPYLLSVETGQRAMSENLAKRISYATGVTSQWLLSAQATGETPLDSFGKEFDKDAWEKFCRWDASRFPGSDFGDVGDEMIMADEEMLALGTALRAAWRLGKFNVALLMLKDLIQSMEKDLNLGALVREERKNDVPSAFLEADYTGELHYRNSIVILLPLLSPLAHYKWSRAFDDGGEKQERFIEEIEDLYKMITDSFELKRKDKYAES